MRVCDAPQPCTSHEDCTCRLMNCCVGHALHCTCSSTSQCAKHQAVRVAAGDRGVAVARCRRRRSCARRSSKPGGALKITSAQPGGDRGPRPSDARIGDRRACGSALSSVTNSSERILQESHFVTEKKFDTKREVNGGRVSGRYSLMK